MIKRILVAGMILLSVPPIQAKPMFERVAVASAGRYPDINRLTDGRLMCVFCAQLDGKMVIVGSFSKDHGQTWQEPITLIDSRPDLDYDPKLIVVGNRIIVVSVACPPDHGSVISSSRLIAVRSEDNCKTWSGAYEIRTGHRYAVGTINPGIVLKDGTVVFSYSWDQKLETGVDLKREGDMHLCDGTLISHDGGLTWTAAGDLIPDFTKPTDRRGAISGVVEPAIVECSDGSIYRLMRTGFTKLYESRSTDGGKSWSKPIASPLTAHNSPASLCRFQGEQSGILVTWNNTATSRRWPLCAAASFDDARTWSLPRELTTLESQQSYPGCVQAADGSLMVVWTCSHPGKKSRTIQGVRFNLEWLMTGPTAAAAPIEWSGKGDHRILVRVDPMNLKGRDRDEAVARCDLDFARLLPEGGEVDLSTLQVHKYDVATGKPEPFRQFKSAISPHDRPCRFEDDKVPVDFPDRDGAASDRPDGRAVLKIRRRAARLFNREMDNKSGHLVWVHTQHGARPSYYAIYFKVRPAGAEVGPSPAPWIGDVDVLRRATGQPLGGLAHFCVGAGDFNGDGLFDFFAGAEKGHVMFFPNRGTRGRPKFIGCQLVPDELGPIDCGWYSAPCVYDWDDDGLPDLLVGTMHNAILWWKKTGTTTEPSLTYKGFVQADGGRLASPETPVAEDHAGIWNHDYYIQPAVCDFNGDGLPDILTGSYTTGQISYFRCTGRDAGGVPILTYVGLVEADGKPIDTCWAAAPTAYDFDKDGKLELITGSWNFQGSTRPVDYLMYYENVGTQAAPKCQRRPFPKIGDFPTGAIARASVVDWNDDGLVDLLISDNGGALRVFLNEGTATNPRWRMNDNSLTGPWCFARMSPTHFSGALDADGNREFIYGRVIATLGGSPYSPAMEVRGSAKVNSKPLFHPGPGYGDPYNFNVLWDWDKDGHSDIFCGTQQGNIFFHRRLETGDCLFAPGIKLKLTTGEDLKVGPPVWDDPKSVRDFTDLQGSRINIAPADYDGDGIDDLVVTETYTNIWVFLNTQTGGTDTFEPGIKVGKTLNNYRGPPRAFDWNKDGKPDLLSGLTVDRPGTVYVNQSTKGQPAFSEPIHPFDLPYVFFGAKMYGMDWNEDGDEDFLIHSEFYEFWAERSFVEHGYRSAVPADAAGGLDTSFQIETRSDLAGPSVKVLP